jgi:hypothetical protein
MRRARALLANALSNESLRKKFLRVERGAAPGKWSIIVELFDSICQYVNACESDEAKLRDFFFNDRATDVIKYHHTISHFSICGTLWHSD